MNRSLRLALVSLAFPVFSAASVQSQEAPSRSVDQPPIAEIRLLVQDWSTREDLDPVGPGETLTLAVGQQVRLRLQALPRGSNRSPRYPSGRFRLTSGERRVQLSKANEETGRVLVEATRVDDPSRQPTVLQYEILTPLDAPRELLTNTIQIVVVDVPEVTDVPDEADASDSETNQRRGATLFEHTEYQGHSELFTEGEVTDLRRRPIGNDRASSVRIDEGCLVELFTEGGLRGSSALLNHDQPRLGDTPVGNDTVSSLRVECREDPAILAELPGATLYSETGFRGRSQHVSSDLASLDGSTIGDNQTRSIELSPGCVAMLYDGAGFRGDWTELRSSESDLGDTRIGLDRVTSIRIRCD